MQFVFVVILFFILTCQGQLNSDTTQVDLSRQKVTKTPLIFDVSDQLIDCDRDDICLVEKPKNKIQKAVGRVRAHVILPHDYRTQPEKCRCDLPNCTIYGDCCLGQLLDKSKKVELIQDSPWECHHLQSHGPFVSVHSYMMSRCPVGTESEAAALCAGDDKQRVRASRKYLLDLPIYSRKTGILYRNIYCARCHLESDQDFLEQRLQVHCNVELNSEEWSQFQRISNYDSLDRTWRVDNITCQLYVDQFAENKLKESIPNIRYCVPNIIDYCPDVSPPNVTDRVRALCPAYAQYVTSTIDQRMYKNAHCFLCHGGKMQLEHFEPQCSLQSDTRISPPGKPDGAGLNFLFDFNLANSNQYVGYEMLCEASEVWDYVRQACHPMLCGKGHVLVRGACQPISNVTTKDEKHQGQGRSDAENGHVTKEDLTDESDCFRILIHESEYTLVQSNKSIAINLSTGGWLYLDENDYEVWNTTTVSICAKYLHHAFQSRFSWILNYLSVGSMGLSVGFLLLHLILYVLLPKLRNLPALNLFCLTLSLFISQFVFLIFITATENQILCLIAAITIHYFFLSAFFWMSSMSWDIWKAFSGKGLVASHTGREKARDSFRKYSAVSWICPMIIVLTAVFFDFGLPPLLGDDSALQSFRPLYGQTGLCWISQRLSLLTFFAIPVGILITANIILFSLTARTIILQNRETSRVIGGNKDSKSSRNRNDEVRLRLYIKLAVIMGLTWILGFISGFLLWDWLWYAFVILNGLQGTFIFFAFDWKTKTLGLLKEKYWNFRKVSTLSGSSGSTTNPSRKTSSSIISTPPIPTVSSMRITGPLTPGS